MTQAMKRVFVPLFLILVMSPCQIFSQSKTPEDPVAIAAGKSMRALEEGDLCKTIAKGEDEAYRFVWLRTFDAPISVRLNVKPDRTGVLKLKITSGKAGYEPGKLVTNKTITVSKEDVDALIFNLENKDGGKSACSCSCEGTATAPKYVVEKFWELPSDEPEIEGYIQLDGADWTVEGCKGDKYHRVTRWSPSGGLVKHMGLYFLTLAKLRPYYDEVY